MFERLLISIFIFGWKKLGNKVPLYFCWKVKLFCKFPNLQNVIVKKGTARSFDGKLKKVKIWQFVMMSIIFCKRVSLNIWQPSNIYGNPATFTATQQHLINASADASISTPIELNCVRLFYKKFMATVETWNFLEQNKHKHFKMLIGNCTLCLWCAFGIGGIFGYSQNSSLYLKSFFPSIVV